jgi:site-specific DNA-methyltransferase (adenine-specific)
MVKFADVLRGRRRWAIVNGDGIGFMSDLAKHPALEGQSVHVITDPPYSAEVHTNIQTGKRNQLPDVVGASCRERRKVDLNFDPMTPEERRRFSAAAALIATRWVITFSDAEGAGDWRSAFGFGQGRPAIRGMPRYFRTGAWVRLGGAPHFNGDGPAPGHEELLYFHAVKPLGEKRRWNGGGKVAVYTCPIVANRKGQQGSRVHPAQKPVPLMIDILKDVVEPGDLVIDPYCGAGTTGVAALRLGCRFIGIEKDRKQGWAKMAKLALKAEENGSDLRRAVRGALPLFPAVALA